MHSIQLAGVHEYTKSVKSRETYTGGAYVCTLACMDWKCRYAFFCWERDWLPISLIGVVVVVAVVVEVLR